MMRRARMPRPRHPLAIEREYARQLRHEVRVIFGFVYERLAPVLAELVDRHEEAHGTRTDAEHPTRRVSRVVELARNAAGRMLDRRKMERAASRVAESVDRHSRGYWDAVREVRSELAISPRELTKGMGPLVDRWTQNNVRLIRSLPEEMLTRIEKGVTRGFEEGARASELKDFLREELGIAERRAETIARTETAQLVSQVQEERAKNLGAMKYVWRTSEDERVRESHRKRNGKVFEYDSPPDEDDIDGNPGEPINCRCTAEPVFED